MIQGGAWIDAQHLRKGDRLINADGTWAEVVSVSVQKQDLTAYNLSVRDYVTFFVAETANDDAVWVHNTTSPPWTYLDPSSGRSWHVGKYSKVKELKVSGEQSNHLSQNAVWKGSISPDGTKWSQSQGVSVNIQGGARGSTEHARYHAARDDYVASDARAGTPWSIGKDIDASVEGLRAIGAPQPVLDTARARLAGYYRSRGYDLSDRIPRTLTKRVDG